MIRQCAWCKAMMGEVAPIADKRVTHGICKKCEDKMRKDLKLKKRG
jgi:hypothetical protein